MNPFPFRSALYRINALVWLLGLLFLAACDKQTSPSPGESAWLIAKEATRIYQQIPAGGPARPQSLSATYQNQVFYYAGQSQDTYRYDDQKRLTNRKATNPDRPDDGYSYNGEWTYRYTDNQLLVTYLNLSPRLPSAYPLNPQGYVDSGSYDADGRLVSSTDGLVQQTLVEGNIVKQVVKSDYSLTTTTFEYDLTKQSLPNPFVVQQGRPSRNLLTKSTQITESLIGMPAVLPDKRVILYRYEFDAQGRVSQQTAYEESTILSDPQAFRRELRITTYDFTR